MSTIVHRVTFAVEYLGNRQRYAQRLGFKGPRQDMASCHCRLTSLRSVEVSTTSCASYSRLSGHCLKMPVKHWSRRSSPVAQTTATLFFGVYLGRTGEPIAVGSERRRPSGYWYSTFRHITPVLRQLHWLPVRQGVDFEVATLVQRSLSGISPSYLANDRRLFADVHERRLCVRSTTCRTCIVSCDVDTFDDRGLQLLDLDYGTGFHRMRNRQTCRTIDSVDILLGQ